MIRKSTLIQKTKMACCGVTVAGAMVPSLAHASGRPGLLWQNTNTGEIAAWMLNGATVTGTQELSTECGPSNDCVLLWNPVQTSGNTILWDNPTDGEPGSGQLGYWEFDANGNVTVEPMLSQTCVPGGGCGTAANRPIGNVTLNLPATDCPVGPTPCTYQGILWVDPGSGNVVIWNMSNATLGSTQANASASIDVSPPAPAILTADIDGDGNTDILWFNRTTGVVSVSLLGGDFVSERNFGVLGTQYLSWSCSSATGCSNQWTIAGAADVNGDGHVDITWFNASTGQVSSWLLDGHGNVTGTQTLSSTCSVAQGCAPAWRPLGYVTFPPCGASGQEACSGTCNPGLVESGATCVACGANSELPCTGNACNKGTVLAGAKCVACGANGELPCTGNACNSGTVLWDAKCVTCGTAVNQVCCASGCGSGLRCSGGFCASSSGTSAGGGGSFCQTTIPCSQTCPGEGTVSLGNFCDLEDAMAAANNGCDVSCQ